MVDLVFTDQSAEKLRLNLVRGAVDKKELTVLCTGQLRFGDQCVVEAGVIGASHYLEVSHAGRVVLTEVFACMDVRSGEREFYGDLQDASSIRKHLAPYQYDFRARVSDWNRGEIQFNELVDAAHEARQGHQVGLVYSFPEEREPGRFPPLTVVYCCLSPQTGEIDVRTLHAYPNEGQLVFTNTTIKKP